MTDAPVDLGDARALRDRFLRWQCRVRQQAVRDHGGRPQPGMCPNVLDREGAPIAEAVITLIHPRDPGAATDRFRHIARRTRDPAERRETVLRFLAADYFQDAAIFSDRLFALFGPGSALAADLGKLGACRLRFAQTNTSFDFACAVARLAPDDAFWQATYWHNYLFNPALGRDAEVLAFRPDWVNAAVTRDAP